MALADEKFKYQWLGKALQIMFCIDPLSTHGLVYPNTFVSTADGVVDVLCIRAFNLASVNLMLGQNQLKIFFR